MSASGLSPARLRRLRDVLSRHVESGTMPGLVALVARRGEVHVEAIGTMEAGGTEPMRRDTGADRDPADPAGNDLPGAAERVPGLLDRHLPGHR